MVTEKVFRPPKRKKTSMTFVSLAKLFIVDFEDENRSDHDVLLTASQKKTLSCLRLVVECLIKIVWYSQGAPTGRGL